MEGEGKRGHTKGRQHVRRVRSRGAEARRVEARVPVRSGAHLLDKLDGHLQGVAVGVGVGVGVGVVVGLGLTLNPNLSP